jgi:hypothetical protein
MSNSGDSLLENLLGSLSSSIVDFFGACAWIVPAVVCTLIFVALCVLLCWIADDLLIELPWLSGPRFIFRSARQGLGSSRGEPRGKLLE